MEPTNTPRPVPTDPREGAVATPLGERVRQSLDDAVESGGRLRESIRALRETMDRIRRTAVRFSPDPVA